MTTLVLKAIPRLPGAVLGTSPIVLTAAGINYTVSLDLAALVTSLNAYYQTVGQIRERITSNRTYFVRTDGNDGNSGLVNTAGGAFLTIQKAYNTIHDKLDLNGFSAVIQVADGTYTSGLSAYGTLVGAGPSSLFLFGNQVTPTNVVINTTNNNAIQVGGGAYVQLRGVQLKTTTFGSCIFVYDGGQVDFFNCDFGAAVSSHIEAKQHGRVNAISNYTISGGSVAHIHSSESGYFSMTNAICTLSGTPAFSSFFVGASFSVQSFAAASFSGAATGTRYLVHNNGLLYTNGGGANFFPGNVAGSASVGGQYV